MRDESIGGRACPSSEDLAAFMDGRLAGEPRLQVVNHLLECAGCYELVRDAGVVLEEAIDRPSVRHLPPRGFVLGLAAAAAIVIAIVTLPLLRRTSDPLDVLADARMSERPFAGRLAALDYAPPAARRRGDDDTPAYALLAAAAEVDEQTRGREDAASLHARGLAELVRGRAEQAVPLLERSAAKEPTAERLSDLAAAHLERGEFRMAGAAAERALRLQPSSTPASFNRALALEMQGAPVAEAIAAWDAYLKLDGRSPWSAEAGRRQTALVHSQKSGSR